MGAAPLPKEVSVVNEPGKERKQAAVRDQKPASQTMAVVRTAGPLRDLSVEVPPKALPLVLA